MVPNNNLSVLPFYTSIEQQDARKWWVYNKIYPLFTPTGVIPPFQILIPHSASTPTISSFKVFTKDSVLAIDATTSIQSYLYKKQFAVLDYDVVIFKETSKVLATLVSGQYYIEAIINGTTYYSEVFTAIDDTNHSLKLEWWDEEDFVMDAGTIVYTNPVFKNILYLCTDLAKPEYYFNEEVIERDGYTFPIKRVSEKRYKFIFIASEYILDVLRLVNMADHIAITKDGKSYTHIDTFTITPEWENNGDVASVTVEFTTDTVAKKLTSTYTPIARGDFSRDFSNDFKNQSE